MNILYQLAPMAEMSHRALRELIDGFGGCDEYFSEMISAAALLAEGPFEKWYIDPGPRPEKLVYQLVGSDIAHITGAAAILDRLECAGIDLNMGCSAPLIRKTGAGVAWMASADRAGELVKSVRKAVKKRLSVKLRIGFSDDFEYLTRFCRRLESEGTDMIILHPRTARVKFKRLAKWDYVGALRQELQIPVAGNGDIATAEELIERANSPCDAVMVGRAAVRQPWIFAQAKQNDNISHGDTETRRHGDEEGDMITCPNLRASVPLCENFGNISMVEETGLRFLELLAQHQPPEFYISRARHFFSYFCDNVTWGNYLKNLINREETLSGIEKVWKDYFTTPELS
ncbi:MAG: tRNA-dihydrouridine synthase family protein [Treponema sp.]|nr:tRNA-dihydrouridine synthase family protein [Treponema sp.]